MATTPNFGVTLVDPSQAQKEVTINQAFGLMDAVTASAVVDKDLATPPGSPVAGLLYIVAASPTGAWSGKATYLTYFDQVWRFVAPQTGMRLWVRDESLYYQFNGTAWVVAVGGKPTLLATNTEAGTTGAQTINQPSGTVNVAAGASSLVVTNSVVGTASIVLAVVRTDDTTAVIKNVVPAAGSFTIRLNAAATAETSVGFIVYN
ncbi:MAG: DUF2793 domain-containing protein [Pseudomonadota bacterium]